MENQAELIQSEMETTREDLGEKVQALQDKVTGDLTAAQESVTETVETVKEGVQDTIATVRDALDVSGHVRSHPWLMVGGAVVVGYLAHELLMGGYSSSEGQSTSSYTGASPSRASEPSTGSWFSGSSLARMFGSSWENLQRIAAATTLELAGQGAKQLLPGDLGSSVAQAVEDMKAELQGPSTPEEKKG
jgi:ElaB/YqjD/DUF883 family membrane-anchored ribosome-binding protein